MLYLKFNCIRYLFFLVWVLFVGTVDAQLPFQLSTSNYLIQYNKIASAVGFDLSTTDDLGLMINCHEPTTQASDLIFESSTSSTIEASFSECISDKYLVIQNTSAILGGSPVDGVIYSVGDALGSGTVLQYSNSTEIIAVGLMSSTTYYYHIYAANDICAGGPEYLIIDPLLGDMTTMSAGYVDYYEDIGDETCEELKTALHDLIDGHTTVTYGSLWTHYQSTDDHLNDSGNENIVWDMYSDNPTGAENEFTFVAEQCGNFTEEGDCYNREHTFPKSWWGGSTSPPQYTDIFTVVPTDGWINGIRANHPYGEVENGTESDITNNGCKVGPSVTAIPGYTGSVFEPTDDYKGDLARGYFYLATRYEDVIDSWENNNNQSDAVLDGTSYVVFESWMLELLISWHNDDPVDQKELDRNDAIYDIQGNRNPYIDHPEYVAAIWSECDYDGSAIDSCIYVYTIADDGPGSLRGAIDCAMDGDTITFSPDVYNATITLTSDPITITENITIFALVSNQIRVEAETPQVASLATLLKIDHCAQVTLQGFALDGAYGPEGSALCNDGLLTLEDMILTYGGNVNANSVLINRVGSSLILVGDNGIE